jgi:hypothetical protein
MTEKPLRLPILTRPPNEHVFCPDALTLAV